MARSRLSRTIVVPSSIRRESASQFCVFRSSIPGPPIPLSTLQATSRDAARKTEGQDGVAVSLLVGLFHSLQHAGLSRRTLINAGEVASHPRRRAHRTPGSRSEKRPGDNVEAATHFAGFGLKRLCSYRAGINRQIRPKLRQPTHTPFVGSKTD
jgi:hypothetical protein